ncbi:MAG: 50S ribosomal protein L11 [Candidatus Aenigmarchaeota archaeon]|nr:50S ribosomal protein L11 [Candidatus Aenigmarchaeota archaeon]
MGDKKEVKVLVEGGKATPAPPLGPSLAPLKINIGQVVAEINEKTKSLAGMQVPVKVTVDIETKKWVIEVGTPPSSALIKKELKVEKGSEAAGLKRIGDLTEEQARKVAKMKFGSDADSFYKQIVGTARSMGVSVGKGGITDAEIKAYEKLVAEKAAEKEAKQKAREAAQATTAGAAAGAPAAAAAPAEKK